MPDVTVGHIEDPKSLEPMFTEFGKHHPGFKIGYGDFDGDDGELVAEHGGVRYIWLESGQGDVFLDVGYRTQEGDGEKLPSDYETDECDDETWPILQALAENLDTMHDAIRPPVESILSRITGRTLTGNIASEIYLLETSGVTPRKEWSTRPKVRRAFDLLMESYPIVGWSTKQVSSFEPIQVGDQLTVDAETPVRVRGKFRYWWIENANIFMSHVTPARRLRYLRDAAGGCDVTLDAFRRLPMTWHCHTETEDEPDGVNTVNSHVVNIAAEASKAYYHPSPPIGGGKAQHKIYFVLDPSVYDLNASGRKSYLDTFPNLNDTTTLKRIPLNPGNAVYIPPNTGHRGIDVFVNVVTLPGFKPMNTIYLDPK